MKSRKLLCITRKLKQNTCYMYREKLFRTIILVTYFKLAEISEVVAFQYLYIFL